MPETVHESDRLFVQNAGLVLLHPYIPILLERLEMIDGDAFAYDTAAQDAAQLLQFVVTGETDADTGMEPLADVLLGRAPGSLRESVYHPSQSTRETVASMLEAVIQNWPALDGTSIEGLRDSFLQREGVLTFVDDGWRLGVETRTLDVLLGTLPWSYSPIRYGWMDKELVVDWR